MELQVVVNWLMGALAAIFGWLFKDIKDDIKELRKENDALQILVHNHELHVAKGYCTRAELKDAVDQANDKLDAIFNKLDTKEDRRRGDR